MIEEAAGMPIPEIFSRFGEAHFRELESRCIAQAAAMSGTVISCGGGAVLRRENVDALRKNSLPVLLTASPATILARTQADTSRPLLSGKKTAADIEGLIAARQSAYENAAGITIDTDGKSVYQICEEIVLTAAGLSG